MFTGIVQAVGSVVTARSGARDRELVVEAASVTPKLTLGASVALDGVCQTVTHLDGPRFTVHAIAETLRVTTLGRLGAGSRVNLETPLGAGDPLGGHFVQGHVDATGILRSLDPLGESIRMRIAGPRELVAELVPKGSITVDGVSLTVGPELAVDRFEVYLIPHTLEVTTLGDRSVGDPVNLETDILGKYVRRFLEAGTGGITWDALRRSGLTDPGGGASS